MVEQELDAVLLRLNRILGGEVDDAELVDAELESTRRAVVAANRPPNCDGRLGRHLVDRLERFGRDVLDPRDALQVPRAVAHDQEADLPLRSLLVDPSLEQDGFPDVVAELADVDPVPRHSRPTSPPLAACSG